LDSIPNLQRNARNRHRQDDFGISTRGQGLESRPSSHIPGQTRRIESSAIRTVIAIAIAYTFTISDSELIDCCWRETTDRLDDEARCSLPPKDPPFHK
jgi:hypothetical protein